MELAQSSNHDISWEGGGREEGGREGEVSSEPTFLSLEHLSEYGLEALQPQTLSKPLSSHRQREGLGGGGAG